MHQSEFNQAVQTLSRMSIPQLQRVAKEATRLAQGAVARAEIEKRAGDRPACPHCRHARVVRWGTSTGIQRWRCAGCKTFNSAFGTGLARTKRRDTLYAFVRNMLAGKPLSCREAAEKFGIDKMTPWRWRMKVCAAIEGYGSSAFAGVVEADETFKRESRKGSCEWVDYEADPKNVPAPPRLRWYEYKREDLPMLRGLSRWQKPILTIMDRNGARRADVLAGLAYKHIGPVLRAHVSSDAVLCSDNAQGYKKFAAVAGVRHSRVAARRGQRVRDKTSTSRTPTRSTSDSKTSRGDFDGPASKNLRRYVAWVIFREIHRNDTDRSVALLGRVISTA